MLRRSRRLTSLTATLLTLLIFGPLANRAAYAATAPASDRAKRRTVASDNSITAQPRTTPPVVDGKSLEEIYKLALDRAETVGIQDELLYQADELDAQAKGALLPSIGSSATFQRQDTATSAVGASIFPSTQNTVKITLDQPVFRGFRDFAALRQRGHQFNSQHSALQEAARQLFYGTATAYYNVLALRSDEFNFSNEIELNRKRLNELESFVRIGRSQVTDVLTQKAQISSLEATLESTRGQLENAKEVLAFYSGLDRETSIQDKQTVPAQAESISLYLDKIEQRPDVRSAVASLQASEEGIPVARGQHLPSIDILGDYYPYRTGSQSDVGWDVALAFTMPIFQGGIILSQTRQAASVARQSALQLSQTRRTAEQEIRQFYDNFSADQRQINKLSETADLSKRNYEAQIREYRNGLVTNLEVLQSITTWQDSLRALSRQQFVAKMDYVKLQAASAQRKEMFIESKKVQ